MNGHSVSNVINVIVVGAGAAGLWASLRAAEAGARVLCLEKTPRTGTKILASGGTRCNLTTTLDGDRARALFGPSGERFLKAAFDALPPARVRKRFLELGVPTLEAPFEKIFPKSGRAKDVRDALERAAREHGAQIELDFPVRGIEREGKGWRVHGPEGRSFVAPRLILAAGGQSYARTGTTGDGYAWLLALRLPLVEPVPALVPLTSPAAWVHELSGIALPGVEARLVGPNGKTYERRRRPVLFTHKGLSGPGAMDLSERVARSVAALKAGYLAPRLEPAEQYRVLLDLCPDLPREELRQRCIQTAGRAGLQRLSAALELDLPRRVLEAMAALLDAQDPDPRLSGLNKSLRHGWIELLKGLPIPIDGTLGFDAAEVTAGGLALKAVDPYSMHVRGAENLFVCGELLDLQGPIGGLNFQAAFATAELAAQASTTY